LIEERLGHVAANIEELQHIRVTLESYIEICKRSEADGACETLEKLDGQ